MHVTKWKADERCRYPTACPKDDVGVSSTAVAHGLVLKINLFPGRDGFNPSDDRRMIGSAVGQGWTAPNENLSVLALVDGRIIGGVGDIDDERDIGMQRVGN